MTAGWDKRSYIRYITEGKVKIIFENETPAIDGELIDVSFTGFSASFTQTLPPEAIVQFSLFTNLMGSESVVGKARIRNVQEFKKYGTPVFRAGFEFIQIDKDVVLDLVNKIQIKICDEAKRRWQSRSSNLGPL